MRRPKKKYMAASLAGARGRMGEVIWGIGDEWKLVKESFDRERNGEYRRTGTRHL